MNYNEVKQRVKRILENNKNARDCDRLLISIMWTVDIFFIEDKKDSSDVLKFLVDGKLTSPETIRRCRQRLQEENETLRGYKYKLRKQLGEEVRQSISR